ncbi:MAG: DUF3179 domain-containing protein [Planctomycetia bacterium]|nr:DUF3179 domain-containing protein [Planctomycetia bacterium]MCC7314699.1 DUF3179 domain-containing protein [Planctomycetota bacterium]
MRCIQPRFVLFVSAWIAATSSLLSAQQAQTEQAKEFQRIRRPGSVNLEKEYAMDHLKIPEEQIHTLLPRDAIPALTDPELESAGGASWLPDDARVIDVTVGSETIGVPLRVLDWHEVVNMTVGDRPVAATYCPLCDSAAVFSREIRSTSGEAKDKPTVLEFGVSGALYNSNVLMYDKTHKGLWSQLGMKAVSGPLAGTSLEALPVVVISFSQFKRSHPAARIVSRNTGHKRDYAHSPYEQYLTSDDLRVPVAKIGSELPRKTLGVGVASDQQAWFVPVAAVGEGYTLKTPAGDVRIARTPAGVSVIDAPQHVRTAQTFYYSWSAFYPDTHVVTSNASGELKRSPGLSVGEKAPDVALTTLEGKAVHLASLYKDGPVVLTFYRGGWCPICNRALSSWRDKLGALEAAGGKFVALSPEKPDHAAKTIEKGHLNFTVLGDPRHEAAKAFRVHFTVDEETKAKYKGFGLDVAESNVSGTWDLPAPATFVIDKGGVVRYAFADWDYKKRADPDEVIAAVKTLTKSR